MPAGRRRPSKLARGIGRQVSTVSIHLAKLRNADIMRYDTTGKETRYWLKHKAEMKGLLRMLGRVVDVSAKVDLDFAFESTLSGLVYLNRLKRWKASGYRIEIVYLRRVLRFAASPPESSKGTIMFRVRTFSGASLGAGIIFRMCTSF